MKPRELAQYLLALPEDAQDLEVGYMLEEDQGFAHAQPPVVTLIHSDGTYRHDNEVEDNADETVILL